MRRRRPARRCMARVIDEAGQVDDERPENRAREHARPEVVHLAWVEVGSQPGRRPSGDYGISEDLGFNRDGISGVTVRRTDQPQLYFPDRLPSPATASTANRSPPPRRPGSSPPPRAWACRPAPGRSPALLRGRSRGPGRRPPAASRHTPDRSGPCACRRSPCSRSGTASPAFP